MIKNKAQQTISRSWNSRLVLAVLAGLLLGLSYPPIPLPVLLFPAWILLFRVIELSTGAREAAFYGYISFVIWNLITTYWLMMASPVAGVAAIFANAAVMTIPFAFQYRFHRRFENPWLTAGLQAAAWTGFEYLHHLWDLAWPWLSLGNAWAEFPELVQYISITGYLGITFWVLLVTALAYRAVWSRDMVLIGPLYGAFAVLFLFPAGSAIHYFVVPPPEGPAMETVVAQPNFDTYEPYGGYASPRQATGSLIELTDSLATNATRLIVWPENGIYPYIASRRISDPTANRVKERLKRKAAEWGASLVAGTRYIEYFDKGEAPPLPRMQDGQPMLVYNAAVGFTDTTEPVAAYRKHNLVPIVERIPYVHFLETVDLLGWVDWGRLQGFGKGTAHSQFRVGGTRTPALICYDSVFPGWVRGFVRDGAGILTIITNDGWWGATSGHIQHWAYARLRAVEFRRWVVRSANNGISGIIGPKGRVAVKTGFWKRTAFRYNVPVLNEMTLYARWGDWLPQLLLLLTAVGFGATFWSNGKGRD